MKRMKSVKAAGTCGGVSRREGSGPYNKTV